MAVFARSLELALLKDARRLDSKKNERAHFMCAFVVFYSVMSVSLEEQRNAFRCLRGDLGKANLSSKE